MSDDLDDDKATDTAISDQYGATEIGTFRNIYGDEFAKDFEPLNKLADALAATGDKALNLVQRLVLRKDHRDGSLAEKIASAKPARSNRDRRAD